MEERCILGMASLSVRHLIQPHVNVSVQPEKGNVVQRLAAPTLEDPLAIQGKEIWPDIEKQCLIQV